jgi:hypothetical protein
MQLMARFRSAEMELTRYRRSVVPKFIAMMIVAMWITGCAPVYTVSQLIDDSTPIDQRLLGTVVAAYDLKAGHFKKLSPHHSLSIVHGPENNILAAAGSVGSLGIDSGTDRHCAVLGFRAGLFVPEPYTGGWAIGEVDLKRTHSCYDSSETFMTDWGESKESGLDSFDSVYAPFFYKVMSIDGFGKEVGKLRADLNLNDIFSFYEIEESTAGIVLIVFPDGSSSEVKKKLLDGLSTRKLDENEVYLVTDNAHAIKEAMFKFTRESDTRLYDAVVRSRGWGYSLGLAYVLISPDDK